MINNCDTAQNALKIPKDWTNLRDFSEANKECPQALKWNDVNLYFQLLGYHDGDKVFLGAYSHPSFQIELTKDQKKGVPQRIDASLPVDPAELSWARLEAFNKEKLSVAAVFNGGGHKDKEVIHNRAIVLEFDSIPKDEQYKRVDTLGLPQPTFMVISRKSVHFYWVFDTPIPVEMGYKLQADLLASAPESDQLIKNPARCMRLPGTWHYKAGEEPFLCTLKLGPGQCYPYQDLRSLVRTFVHDDSDKRAQKLTTTPVVADFVDAETLMAIYPDFFRKLPESTQEQLLKQAYEEIAPLDDGRKTALNRWAFFLGLKAPRGISLQRAMAQLETAAAACGIDINLARGLANKGLCDGVARAMEEHPDYIADTFQESIRLTPGKADASDEREKVGSLDRNDKQCLVVKSFKGSGKTEMLQLICEEARSLKRRVLLVGHRCLLIRQNAQDLNMTYYEGVRVGTLDDQRSLAISFDSLHKLSLTEWQGSLIILDETSAGLRHLTGETQVEKHRSKVNEMLGVLINTSYRTVALDADMTKVEIDYLAHALGDGNLSAGREKMHIYVNSAKPKPRRFVEVESFEHLTRQLIKAVEQGENLFVTCNTKRQAEEVFNTLCIRFPELDEKQQLRLITSETSSNKEVKDLAKTPNKFIPEKKLRVLVSSPSLGIGVSITVEHFQAVYSYVSKAPSQSATDVLQHIWRVRCPEMVYFHVESGIQNVEVHDARLRAKITQAQDRGFKSMFDREISSWKMVDSGAEGRYNNLYLACEHRHNCSIRNLRRSLLQVIKEEGHTLVLHGKTSQEIRQESKEDKQLQEVSAEGKAYREEKEKQYKENLMKPPTLTPAEIEDIERALKHETVELSPEQRVVLEACRIREAYCIDANEPLSPELLHFDDKGKGRGQLYRYRLLKEAQLDWLEEKDWAEHQDKGVYDIDQKRFVEQAKLLRRLIHKAYLEGVPYCKEALTMGGLAKLMKDKAPDIERFWEIKVGTKYPARDFAKILKLVGLTQEKVKSEKVKENGKEQKVIWYKVSQWSLENMEKLCAQTQNKHLSELFKQIYKSATDNLNHMTHSDISSGAVPIAESKRRRGVNSMQTAREAYTKVKGVVPESLATALEWDPKLPSDINDTSCPEDDLDVAA